MAEYKSLLKDVHTEHCCLTHGCKYGRDATCTVTQGMLPQSFPCEECEYTSELETDLLYCWRQQDLMRLVTETSTEDGSLQSVRLCSGDVVLWSHVPYIDGPLEDETLNLLSAIESALSIGEWSRISPD